MKILKFHIFFHPTFCMKKSCFKALIHAPIGLSAGYAQKFFSHSKKFDGEYLGNSHFPTKILEKLVNFPEKLGNFRNLSNFEELYLRAQRIFFDGIGTITKIYV